LREDRLRSLTDPTLERGRESVPALDNARRLYEYSWQFMHCVKYIILHVYLSMAAGSLRACAHGIQ